MTSTLDKDLAKLGHVEEATTLVARRLLAPGLALLFMAVMAVLASTYVFDEPRAVIIVAAAVIAAYMAMNIGANDVANNVGAAVGARALTMGGALAIAAIFEIAGALIAGGDVVETVASGIVDQAALPDAAPFIRLMLSALVSAALWVHFSTWIGAPVSTTHSIVGGVVGAGVAAAGFGAVNWPAMAAITASWVLSPVLGGAIAAAFLAFIKTSIIYRDDKISAARRWVPLLIGVMAGAFSAYLALKGLQRFVILSSAQVAATGIAGFALTWWLAHRYIRRISAGMENRNQSLRELFTLPLIFSAALLSFAHGANDVANAVGPLAAIVRAASAGQVVAFVEVPLWVMLVGALGISVGLLLFGPKLIRMVGEHITRLNPMRAFCVALSAALTVIAASWFGLPISSTHVAVGAVFGVGFYREWYTARSRRRQVYMERRNQRWVAERRSDGGEKRGVGKAREIHSKASREEIARRKLVRRAHVTTIVAAWVTTVPAAALLAAGVFLGLGLLGR
jgi:PiT family inorganic phosphate transporter